MYTISLENWSHFEELEKAFYEKQTYENLLGYMSNARIVKSDSYFAEYQEVIKRYTILCRQLEQEVILPTVNQEEIFWEVDFVNKNVIIKEKTE
jgi:hypothetical protein